MTGQHKQVTDQNEREAWQALMRDRQQRDNLIQRQLEERNALQRDIRNIRQARLQKQFEQQQSRQNRQSPDQNNDYDLSI